MTMTESLWIIARPVISLTRQSWHGRMSPLCPHRLEAQDVALSRPKLGFESPWGHLSGLIPNCMHGLLSSFFPCYASKDVAGSRTVRRADARAFGMIAFNSTDFFLQNQSGILIDKFITVQVAAEVSGYNAQYLRRLLRAGKLDGIRIGQVWLIRLESLAAHLEWGEEIEDRRCGPRKGQPALLYTDVDVSSIRTYTGIVNGG